MRVGAHLPTRSGPLGAIDAARATGAEAFQLFASNPRAWPPPRIADGVALDFRSAVRDERLGPVFVHAPYLVNIASPNPEFLRKSVDLGAASMDAAEALGARGLVVHAGSGGPGEPARALDRAVASVRRILLEGSAALLVVELTAGGAGSVAATFPQAGRLFERAGWPERLALCADTCHLFAAGYGLDTAEGVRDCFAELRRARLARRLVLVHANDAKHPRGSRRDSHEHVGEGRIGRAGFAAVLAQPAVRRSAVLCETPGTLEDHRRNIEAIRELAG